MRKVLSILAALAILATMSAFTMTASATTSTINAKYELPVDDIDQWVAENMEPYAWSQPLAEGVDTIEGEVTSEGLALSFPEDGYGYTYPHARVDNAGGLIQTTEDDYINIKATLATEEKDIRWSLTMHVVEGRIGLASMIGDAAGVELFNGKQLPGGDYDATFKISDAIKAHDEANETQIYDAMYGIGGNSYITGFSFYIYSEKCVTGKALTIKELTVGPMEGESTTTSAATSETSSVDSEASSADSETSSIASQTSSLTSQSDADEDSSNMMVPVIIGVAALVVAAAAVVTVIVIKKKKNNKDKA